MYGNVLKVIDQLPILPHSKEIAHRHWPRLTTSRKGDLFHSLVKALVPCENNAHPRDLLALLHHIHYVIEPQLSRDKPSHLLLFESPKLYREALCEWPKVSERRLLSRVIDKLQNRGGGKKPPAVVDTEVKSPVLLAMIRQYRYLIQDQILPHTGKTMKRRTQLGFTFQGYNDTPVTLHHLTALGDLEPARNYKNRARRHLHHLYTLLDTSYPAISTVHYDTLKSQLISESRTTKRLYDQLFVRGYTFENQDQNQKEGTTYHRIRA